MTLRDGFAKILDSYGSIRSALSRFKGNFLWMNTYQAMNILTSIFMSIAFARLASKELYGQYIFVISIVSFVSLVSMPGVRTTIFRSASRGNESFYRNATKFSFLWSLLGIPLLTLTGIYFYVTHSQTLGTPIIMASLFFPFMYSLQTWKNLLKAKEKFSNFVLYESSLSITKAVLVIGVLLVNSENLIAIMFVYFLATALLNSYFYLKSLGFIGSEDEANIEWRQESYEYTFLNFTSYTFSKIDRVLVGIFLPFSQIAIYNISMKVTDTLFKFTKSSIESVLPGFFKDEYRFSHFFPVFILLFLVPVTLYPLVKYPITLLYTEKYSESVFYAQIYLFAVPFYFMAYVSSQALIKEHLSREVNKARMTSIVFFILTSLALIPQLGVLGGVIASLAYYPIQILLCMYYLRKNDLL